MFLFNFYSNTDFYIMIFLSGLIISVCLFILSVMFDTKRMFFLFVISAIVSFLLNTQEVPVELIIIFFGVSSYFSKNIKGRLEHKVFLNILSFLVISILTSSGYVSVSNFIEKGDKTKQTLFKQEIPTKLKI